MCTNKNCIGGVITFDGQTGKPCKKCNPVPKKEATNKSITIYGVGKYRDDTMTISKEEAMVLMSLLYTALKDEYNSHANIAIPTIIDKTN